MSRYPKNKLIQFTKQVLENAGMENKMVIETAKVLVEADLMGHSSHGLNLLTPYLNAIANGSMNLLGDPEVIHDSSGTICWDGKYLPGPWLIQQGISECLDRLYQSKVATLVIRNSSHIGCLAVYLEQVTQAGFMILLACSDPSNKTVAPFGSNEALYSPNPLAVGIPTDHLPIIFDTSMSTTANGVIAQKLKQGKRLPAPWLQTTDGKVSDDPKHFFDDPPATILPLGGLDSGYKGFALGILIEAITSGLAGFGRSDQSSRWGANVFLQLIDPDGFGGKDLFVKEMSYFRDKVKNSAPINKHNTVRLPGERSFKLREDYEQNGAYLDPVLVNDLKALASNHHVPFPHPI